MNRSCARAPVRVDAGGGGTDAPPFSVEHGGMVVNFAVKRHAFASVDRLPASAGAGVTIYSNDLLAGVSADSVAELPPQRLEFLQAFVRRLVPDGESVLLVTESDVPPGAGLGGSGALGVAVVAALDHAFGQTRSPEETARLANDIERKDLGFPGGDQDSFGAALGGINQLEYPKGRATVPQRLEVAKETRLALEHNSLLIYTNEAHVSGNIHQDIKESYALPNSPTVDAMIRLRESATAMARALEDGDLHGYADCLNTSCDNLYRLHPSCDSEGHRQMTSELEGVILGRKTCGAGGGGFMVVLAKPGHRHECKARAEKRGALVWSVVIDFEGVSTWSQNPTHRDDLEKYRALSRPS
jgi:D-glycero-alpha-D-manno-heptose-7-phosphate kinase